MTGSRPLGKVQYDNQGRVVLVTGGCGGIGQAICQEFLQSGAAGVVCADRNAQAAENLPAEIIFQQLDVSSHDQCRQVVDWTIDRFGAIDVLVNTAAIQPPESYVGVDQLSEATWNRMLSINLSGYTFMAKHVLAIMKKQRSGVIVNIASAQGHRTARDVPAYGPIKAANLMQARQWGLQYARDGVRVVSVSPGAIDTSMLRASLAGQGGEAELSNRHPLGRIGTTEEVARAVLWLASADASFITATDLAVDGGLGAMASFADPYPRSSDS